MSVIASPDRRGRYDRSLTSSQRSERQRQRIVQAALEVLDERGAARLTVDPVVQRAHVGRNTFYAHFDDIGDLIGGVREWSVDRLFDVLSRLEQPRVTPLERLRALAHAWIAVIDREPVVARTALSHVVGADARYLGSRVVERLAERLGRIAADAFNDGLSSALPSHTTLVGLAGAFVSVGLGRLSRGGDPCSDAADVLSTLAARALR